MSFKKIFTNWKIILLIVFLILSIVAIGPNFFNKGVVIKKVVVNSTAEYAGIKSPKADASPMSLEKIESINNIEITSLEQYYNVTNSLLPDQIVKIRTNRGTYNLQAPGFEDVGLKVEKAPKTNLRKGLDIQGGTRVLLQPERQVTPEEMDLIISNMKERLNVFGLSDVVIRTSKDFSGNDYILIEIAGVNEEEVKELIAKQGKFEAKIANTTAFSGGNDIAYVCRTTDCSGISREGCQQYQQGYMCKFQFSITLKPEAARRQANATANLQVISGEGSGNDYLSEKIDFYLDDSLVDSLNIGADLKGVAATDIAISGTGVGATRDEAVKNSLDNMKRLQTILTTGSLPVKLNVVKTDNLSPEFGNNFLRNAILVAILALITVSIIMFVRYRKVKIAAAVLITMAAEIILILGFAAVVKWQLDLVAIAGIIVAVGTGVDDQLVIADETLKKENAGLNWKQRIKKAFFVIFVAFFATVAAMVPLLFAGAGLVKGFALTTIVGVTAGVFITRPAFGALIEILLNNDDKE